MELFEFSSQILPEVTLFGYNSLSKPTKNIRRVSDDYILYIVTAGEWFFKEDGKDYTLRAGDCFLFEPGLLHIGTQPSVCSFYYVHFRHPAMEKIRGDSALRQLGLQHSQWLRCGSNGPYPSGKIPIPKWVSFAGSDGFQEIVDGAERVRHKRDLRLEHFDTVAACAVTELLVQICRQFILNRTRPAGERQLMAQVHEVVAFLHGNYRKKITGQLLEETFSYSFDYLNRSFRQQLNMPIFKYLLSVRLQAAKDLLKNSNAPIGEIANKVGYDDDTYFYKVFKKETGFSPRAYRQKVR